MKGREGEPLAEVVKRYRKHNDEVSVLQGGDPMADRVHRAEQAVLRAARRAGRHESSRAHAEALIDAAFELCRVERWLNEAAE